MKKTLTALLITVATIPAQAADTYTIDPRHTFPSFEINHLGFSIQRGRFDKSSGKVVLDPKSAAGGSIDVTVETNSISTGLTELEEHLRGKDFFDVAQHPHSRFVSNKLIFSKDNLTAIDGNLTLHGITKPIHLTVNHFHCGINPISMKHVCGVDAATTIKRSEFGIDKYVPMVGDEVKITIQVEAIKD